ncbi:MAG: type II toxin-antitoxin system HicB family antitoxin [Oscillospiraceae bacterium]|nr:type II toxin-antitoxin system HicB family antitoxin [Oscillospiraceae bacterium]
MNNALSYKDYYGTVEFCLEDKILFGRVIGINDHITYEGFDVKSLQDDFQNAVDAYIEHCIEIGKKPQKTYKGSFNIRIKPDLHSQLVVYSDLHGMSLNSTVEKAIQEYIS